MLKNFDLRKVAIWVSAYINIIAFTLVGGYSYLKIEDEDIKQTTKKALIVTLIFIGVDAIITIISQFGSMFPGYYSSALYDIVSVLTSLAKIIKIGVYVYCIFKFAQKQQKEEVIEIEEVEIKETENQEN